MYKQITLALGLLFLPLLASAQEGRHHRADLGLEQLPTELQLSEEQRAELDKIRAETQTAYEQLREAEAIDFDQIRQLHRERREKAKAVLTEEQRNYLENLRDEHHRDRLEQREARWEQHCEMYEAIRAYHEENIQPKRLKARLELEVHISAADRQELASLREVMASHPRHRTDGPPAFEDRRQEFQDRRRAFEEWRDNHQTDLDRINELTEKYREQIDAQLATLSEFQDQWREDMKAIRKEFRPEDGHYPRHHRGHRPGRHGHHPPPPPNEGDERAMNEALDHDRDLLRARAFLMLPVESITEEIEVPSSDFDQISLAPNPAADQVVISYRLLQVSPVQISIMDESGRLVQQLPKVIQEAGFQQTTLQISDLPAGNYRVVIENDHQRLLQSLVVGRK